MITYNEQTKQYEQDGTILDEVTILALIAKLEKRAKRDAIAISRKLQQGLITIEEWSSKMDDLITSTHIITASVGRGGLAQMATEDWGRVSNTVTEQRQYLARFAGVIRAGAVEATRLANQAASYLGGIATRIARRAATYLDAPYVTYQQSYRQRQTQGSEPLVRLIQNSKEGCSQCKADADRGWVPVSQMAEIGTRICKVYCKCRLIFRD